MARIKCDGLDDYIAKLQKLGDVTEDIIKQAVYEGAGVLADGIRSSIQSLPTVKDSFYVHDGELLYGVTEKQKQGLLDGLGISEMKNEAGYINVKIGFNGYNSEKTRKYPQGQPNALIARSVESGTSVRIKRPFVRPAVARNKAAAEDAMRKTVDKLIAEKMKK